MLNLALAGEQLLVRGAQQLLQCFLIQGVQIGKGRASSNHDRSMPRTSTLHTPWCKRNLWKITARIYTANCGSHVRSGRRQSIPSSSIDNCARVSDTVPLLACGHTKRPRSSRLYLTPKCKCFAHSDASCAHHASVPPV